MRLMVVFLLTAVAMSAIVAGSESVLKATTEDGRKVFLYPDGTWQYQDKKAEIPIRSKPFTSMRLYEDKSGKFKIWVHNR